jgi:hypothetical protein
MVLSQPECQTTWDHIHTRRWKEQQGRLELSDNNFLSLGSLNSKKRMNCRLIYSSLASAFCPPLCAISPSRSSPFWRNLWRRKNQVLVTILLEDHGWQCTEATHWRLRETLHVDQEQVIPDILPRKFAVTMRKWQHDMVHNKLQVMPSKLKLVFETCRILLYFQFFTACWKSNQMNQVGTTPSPG